MIVARCWSGRFPGKVLASLYDRPVIEWIIEKAKRLTPGAVVIAGSDDPRDLPLVHIARTLGISCARGPAQDLLARMERAADVLELTHWVGWSGDSPFADERVAWRILEAIHAHPEGPDYTAGPYPAGTTGIHTEGCTRAKLLLARDLMMTDTVQTMLAAGWDWWHMGALLPGCFGGPSIVADITDLFCQPESLFSMCIDYPLQLVFWNRVCEWVGHFPNTAEILHAHKEMVWL